MDEREPQSESSFDLLQRARDGDAQALETLCARYRPALHRWASGRLPRWARDLLDTDDLVQETLLRTLGRLREFEPRSEGALRAYLRQAVLNQIRDEVRRAQRRPLIDGVPVANVQTSPEASPLEEAIGRETLVRYESALGRLRDEDREAIVARLEMCCSYEELAVALGKPSANAARMAVQRALLRLAREMTRDG